MIRDFSEEKKEELYKALEVIDIKEWKPFMTWCGGRAGEFGVWADRLGISAYTGRIDNYQNRVLDTNDSTRNQIDIIFENVVEVDHRYSEIFRRLAEVVKEQIAQVQTMTYVMNTGSETGGNIGGLVGEAGIVLSEEPEEVSIREFEEMLSIYYKKGSVEVTYEELCDYLKKLLEQHYICQIDYNSLVASIYSYGHVPSSVQDIIYNRDNQLLADREALINNFVAQGWERGKIMCVLQTDILLTRAGFEEEFVMGVLGNIICEGGYGVFENAAYSNPDDIPPYLVHMINCVNYDSKYNGYKEVTEVDLMQLYYDLVCEGETCDKDSHKFGLGSVQWTGDRTTPLVELYLKECGFDVESELFEEKLDEYQRAVNSGDFSEYEGVYINSTQVQSAEMRYIVYGLNDDYYYIYENYLDEKGNNSSTNIRVATEIVMKQYEIPDETKADLSERQAAAENWYQFTRE